MEFQSFPKMGRLYRDIIISEKIDGTNAQILITDDGQIKAGSRNRWITPDDDNYGFARWVNNNAEELLKLGPGRHFGEWWGNGIQRGYGLKEKKFSLFNSSRWNGAQDLPKCCSVVPVLYHGIFQEDAIKSMIAVLKDVGSLAAPGFMRPEGIVVYHTASGAAFKYTLDNDNLPKSKVNEE